MRDTFEPEWKSHAPSGRGFIGRDGRLQPLTWLAALFLLAMAGCQSPPVAEPLPPPVVAPEPKPAPEPAPPPPAPVVRVPTPSEQALAAGIGLYDAGDFNGAIKLLLGAKAIWEDASVPGGPANKATAHKYIAFSYCVTNRRTLCRQQFVAAMKIDPMFQLEPAEKTHPIWGPEFELAKKQASVPPPPPKRPAAPAKSPSNPPKAP